MLGIILGIFTIALGAKAFTPAGLPLTGKTNITGATAKTIGMVCILFGAVLVLSGIVSAFGMLGGR